MMRTLVVATFVTFALSCSVALECAAGADPSNTEAQRLESYAGKYPSDLFKGEPSVKQRLRTLLGANYSFFMQRLQTEMPIENAEGVLIGRGCMAHSCGAEEAIFAINLSDGKIHCGILSQKYGGKFKVFSEDKNHIPPALRRAMRS